MNNKLEGAINIGKKIVRMSVAAGLAGAIPFGVTNVKDISTLTIHGKDHTIWYFRDPPLPIGFFTTEKNMPRGIDVTEWSLVSPDPDCYPDNRDLNSARWNDPNMSTYWRMYTLSNGERVAGNCNVHSLELDPPLSAVIFPTP